MQAWQRLLPMRGFDPWKPGQAAMEFHLSHWSGPVALLEVSQNWTYGGQWQGLFGRLTYAALPVFGTRTPSASKRDAYGRFVYIDTRNSVYGTGWRHDAGKALHLRNGAFCYSFVPQTPPPVTPTTRRAALPSATCTGHCHGAGRDPTCSGRGRPSVRTTPGRTPATTRSSTGWSDRTTASAPTSADATSDNPRRKPLHSRCVLAVPQFG